VRFQSPTLASVDVFRGNTAPKIFGQKAKKLDIPVSQSNAPDSRVLLEKVARLSVN
jgi:hypothetical protein